MTREELREICAGLMGWRLDPDFAHTEPPVATYIGSDGVNVCFKYEYRPDSDPAQALELLIKVAGRNWEIDGEEQCVYVFNSARQLAARQVLYDNTPAGIAFAICKAVCRAKGIDVGEVE